MPEWILDRLFDTNNQPIPRFAFQGTVNWMRALAVLVQMPTFEDTTLRALYSRVNRRATNRDADTMVFENMLMAYHNHASLVRLAADVTHPYDICRLAIISWYYGTYFTCSAMIAAASGTQQEAHASTARVWQSDIIIPGLVAPPFSFCLTSLVKADVASQISAFRGANAFDLNHRAGNADIARGGIISYLKGTAEYEQWKLEERVRATPQFKALGVDNFRTKAARELRDAQFSKAGVNFLTQAFRYRGKVNYRDSIFMSYGDDHSSDVSELVQDAVIVSRAFQRMAAHYLHRRVESGAWQSFIDDLRANSRLSLAVDYLIP